VVEYNNRPHICFVAHFAYGAMAGGDHGHIGGVERQTSLMARWLVGRGYRVSLLTWDEGQEDGAEIDGVRVWKMCRHKAGITGLRFLWPRWTSLVAAMRRADADVYYQNCAECVTGQVALWCHRHGRRFVFSAANDPDCDRRLPDLPTFRARALYRYGLKTAHRIIVQTHKQQAMLREGFGYDSVVLPMPCPGPSEQDYVDCEQQRHSSRRVLWIGRICEQKRPDRLLDLATTCPDLEFDLVGPLADTAYARCICERARATANVVVHGPVARDRVPDFYQRASVLCCTSDFEGFPNTFLEAWSYGLPIVSTFDPDNIIAEKGLGSVGKDVTALASGVRALLDSPDQWRGASRAAREYYVQNHAMDEAMLRFERVFREVAGAARDGDGGCT